MGIVRFFFFTGGGKKTRPIGGAGGGAPIKTRYITRGRQNYRARPACNVLITFDTYRVLNRRIWRVSVIRSVFSNGVPSPPGFERFPLPYRTGQIRTHELRVSPIPRRRSLFSICRPLRHWYKI